MKSFLVFHRGCFEEDIDNEKVFIINAHDREEAQSLVKVLVPISDPDFLEGIYDNDCIFPVWMEIFPYGTGGMSDKDIEQKISRYLNNNSSWTNLFMDHWMYQKKDVLFPEEMIRRLWIMQYCKNDEEMEINFIIEDMEKIKTLN